MNKFTTNTEKVEKKQIDIGTGQREVRDRWGNPVQVADVRHAVVQRTTKTGPEGIDVRVAVFSGKDTIDLTEAGAMNLRDALLDLYPKERWLLEQVRELIKTERPGTIPGDDASHWDIGYRQGIERVLNALDKLAEGGS